jgi:hypothetical protein
LNKRRATKVQEGSSAYEQRKNQNCRQEKVSGFDQYLHDRGVKSNG